MKTLKMIGLIGLVIVIGLFIVGFIYGLSSSTPDKVVRAQVPSSVKDTEVQAEAAEQIAQEKHDFAVAVAKAQLEIDAAVESNWKSIVSGVAGCPADAVVTVKDTDIVVPKSDIVKLVPKDITSTFVGCVGQTVKMVGPDRPEPQQIPIEKVRELLHSGDWTQLE